MISRFKRLPAVQRQALLFLAEHQLTAAADRSRAARCLAATGAGLTAAFGLAARSLATAGRSDFAARRLAAAWLTATGLTALALAARSFATARRSGFAARSGDRSGTASRSRSRAAGRGGFAASRLAALRLTAAWLAAAFWLAASRLTTANSGFAAATSLNALGAQERQSNRDRGENQTSLH